MVDMEPCSHFKANLQNNKLAQGLLKLRNNFTQTSQEIWHNIALTLLPPSLEHQAARSNSTQTSVRPKFEQSWKGLKV